VNAGFAAYFGWHAPNQLNTDEWLALLSNTGDEQAETRSIIANQFRRPSRDGWAPGPWPWMYGDAMTAPTQHTSNAFTSLTRTQLHMLDRWATGNFINDYKPGQAPPQILDAVPIVDQPDMLTRAALEFCLADAFHPGCEMTWPVRHPTMYMGPFRFRHAASEVEPSYPATFTPDLITRPDGPFFGQVPGGITRWMAVPWQTDTASCRSGYNPPDYNPHLPTFWPARVPNQVLEPADYQVVKDSGKPLGDRLKAFARRNEWLWDGSDYMAEINYFVTAFGQMGLVETQKGPGDGSFPSVIEVADRPRPPLPSTPKALAAEPTPPAAITKIHRFPRGLKQLA